MISRRNFLVGGLILALPLKFDINEKSSTLLSNIFNNISDAASIGKKIVPKGWLESSPQVHVFQLKQRLQSYGLGELRESSQKEVLKAIKLDFKTDKVIMADGWLLAESELRLYALAAIYTS